MNSALPSPPSFWRTVRLLLATARQRASGRRNRTRELLQHRKGTDWGPLGFALGVLVMMFINVSAAILVNMAVTSGQRLEVERQGKIVVSVMFLDAAKRMETSLKDPSLARELPEPDYASEAGHISRKYGGAEEAVAQKLRDTVREHGTRDLILEADAAPGFTPSPLGTLPAMLGSMVLLWWGVMLVFQGEGLELDLQRRRHPLWEWLFSHPVPPGAVFLADMISPIAANPIYWGAPLFAGVLYGLVYDPGAGFLATFLIGLPVTVAAACLGKALEIGVILRFSPRTRGAVVGFMGWIGFVSMMLFFVGLYLVPTFIAAAGKFLVLFTFLPWPWLKLFLGAGRDGSYSFFTGVFTCWTFAALVVAGAVAFSVWGTQKGLSGNVSRADAKPSVSRKKETRFGREPLYRKEFLWFVRDRSAIVQTILIPLTVAGFQLFQLRGIVVHVHEAWNYVCGAAILFGTYFLWVLGPKSLSSEGAALWIALTWPRGLESLLKAKAWLWSIISSVMVAMVLAWAVYLFPTSIWQILLVGIGWFLFARSMAEKTVTLVTVPSSSGEPEKIPTGRRWAAQLGMLTFSIGVLTQQWPLAVRGIVYSYVTAAAMWEQFRARLPYLYDPWSEKLPPAPTLMHAMVAVSILVEGGAVVTGILVLFSGPEGFVFAQAMAYAMCAVAVSLGVASFLGDRGVSVHDVWHWKAAATSELTVGAPDPWWRRDSIRKFVPLLLVGAAGGVVLGLVAHGYLAVLEHLPATAETIRKSQEQLAKIPGLRVSYAIAAVGFAPFAEEYLFRGLLFRALDRQWGGWRAVAGSAAFFAIYHPPLSWPPVVLLGAANAWLFKKTRRLLPAVILHLVYNAVVLI